MGLCLKRNKMANATTFIKERKNILIISIIVLAVVLVIHFMPSDEIDESNLGILSDQMPSILDDYGTGDESTGSVSNSQQKEITIPEGTEFYCEWSWPQKIINKATKEVYWVCPISTPYCKSGTSTCCKHNSATEEHYDCIEMNQ